MSSKFNLVNIYEIFNINKNITVAALFNFIST
jgi:hypothetical protein